MKPVVRYVDRAGPLVVGLTTRVFTRDHYRVTGWLLTTTVERIDGAEFETRNTIYKPYRSDLPLDGKVIFTSKEKSIA